MQNIIKHITERCKQCDGSIKNTVDFLRKNGDLSYTSEYHREIWHHYIEEAKISNRITARRRTEQLFKIHRNTLSKIICKYGRV